MLKRIFKAFGVICSPTANSIFDGKLAYVAGWEDVLVWDTKRGEMVRPGVYYSTKLTRSQVSMWHSPSLTSPVTHILAMPIPSTSSSTLPRVFGVAYTNGSIRLWSYDPSSPEANAVELVTFDGHKKSVTTMAFDAEGSRLASGGTEGEIVVWDRVAELGLFRLRGHRGPVTAIHFIPHPTLPITTHPGFIVSTARDTYLKLWDLSTQHCVQTVVVGRGEVWSCAVKEEDADEEEGEIEGAVDEEDVSGRWVVITGSADGEGRVFVIGKRVMAGGVKENANGEVRGSTLHDNLMIHFSCQRSLNRSATSLNHHPLNPSLKLPSILSCHSSFSRLRIARLLFCVCGV